VLRVRLEVKDLKVLQVLRVHLQVLKERLVLKV
jgi:hypothetical protein